MKIPLSNLKVDLLKFKIPILFKDKFFKLLNVCIVQVWLIAEIILKMNKVK